MTNQCVKYENFLIKSNQDNKRKSYYYSRRLWPSDPKINLGHLLVMTNQYVIYNDFAINCNKDNERKPLTFEAPENLTFNLMTQNQ
jgi:hypothetical protein